MKGNDPSGRVWKATTIGDTPIVHWTMILGARVTPNEVCEKWIKKDLQVQTQITKPAWRYHIQSSKQNEKECYK